MSRMVPSRILHPSFAFNEATSVQSSCLLAGSLATVYLSVIFHGSPATRIAHRKEYMDLEAQEIAPHPIPSSPRQAEQALAISYNLSRLLPKNLPTEMEAIASMWEGCAGVTIALHGQRGDKFVLLDGHSIDLCSKNAPAMLAVHQRFDQIHGVRFGNSFQAEPNHRHPSQTFKQRTSTMTRKAPTFKSPIERFKAHHPNLHQALSAAPTVCDPSIRQGIIDYLTGSSTCAMAYNVSRQLLASALATIHASHVDSDTFASTSSKGSKRPEVHSRMVLERYRHEPGRKGHSHKQSRRGQS